MSQPSAMQRLGDYLASEGSSSELLRYSVEACLAAAGLFLITYFIAAAFQNDPKRRHDWLEGSVARLLFRLFFRALMGAAGVGVTHLIGFPGQMMPVVVLVAIFLPYGFLVDVLNDFLISPWQAALRRVVRTCKACGKPMTLLKAPVASEKPDRLQVDYDEWTCACGAVRVDGYGGGKPLSDCPKCGFKTWESRLETIRPATAHADGQGLDHRQCVHCRHEEKTPVVLRRRH